MQKPVLEPKNDTIQQGIPIKSPFESSVCNLSYECKKLAIEVSQSIHALIVCHYM